MAQGVTTSLITNWLFVKYLKTNEINKSIVDGSMSPVFQDIMMVQKKSLEQGKQWTIPQWGGGKKTTGRNFSAVQSRNQAGATGSRLTFVHSMVPNFDEVDLDREAMLASKTNAGAFFATLQTDIDQSVMAMNQDITRGFYGGNDIGQLSRVSSVSGKVITLIDAAHSLNFEPGMYIEIAAAKYDGSTDRRRVEGSATVHRVDKVNQDDGTITMDGTVAALAANDYIWREGDYLNASNESVQLMGFLDYAPSTLAANDSYLGTNRSVAPSRLSGLYRELAAVVSGQDVGDAIYNGIVSAVVDVSKRFPGFMVNKIYANPEVLKQLQLSSTFKSGVRWINDMGEARRLGTIGFTAFKVLSSKGDIPVVFDSFCPEKRIIGVNTMTWNIAYLSEDEGKVVNFKTEKGERVLLSRTANSNVVFLESYHFLCGKLPGSNFVLNLDNLI